MKRGHEFIGYSFLFAVIVLVDQLTKAWVVRFLPTAYYYSPSIAFDIVVNRGVSWGMFHSLHDTQFFLITAMIIGIVYLLAVHAYTRFVQKFIIIGEVMVLAGAISNISDRFFYHGVIDFIHITLPGGYVWPAFNGADVSIVLGVFIMLIAVYRKP